MPRSTPPRAQPRLRNEATRCCVFIGVKDALQAPPSARALRTAVIDHGGDRAPSCVWRALKDALKDAFWSAKDYDIAIPEHCSNKRAAISFPARPYAATDFIIICFSLFTIAAVPKSSGCAGCRNHLTNARRLMVLVRNTRNHCLSP